MRVNIKKIFGKFDLGFVLDKHSLYSIPTGHDEYGHMLFDTRRSDVGEALYQLKYRQQRQYVLPLARAIQSSILPLLPAFGLIIPMAASAERTVQPVTAVADMLGQITGKPVFELLRKTASGPALKDLRIRSEKEAALAGTLTLNRLITTAGRWNALLLDDLYHTGATLDAASDVLRTYEKIGQIYVAALTWR